MNEHQYRKRLRRFDPDWYREIQIEAFRPGNTRKIRCRNRFLDDNVFIIDAFRVRYSLRAEE